MSGQVLRPPMPYFGGKTRLAAQITAVFGEHRHYVEPYAGSLAVLLAKPVSVHETVNDLDGDLVTFWRVLRDRPDDLAAVCALTPHSRTEHASSYGELTGLDEVEQARRVWVQLTQGRAGVRARTGWRHYQDPGGSSASMPGYLAGYLARIHPAAARLARVSLECRPALDVIADYGHHTKVLLYVDPPYLATTRTKPSPGRHNGYLHDMPAETDHTRLLDALQACRAQVVVSGYPSALYDTRLSGWDRVEIPTSTGQGGVWSARTEVLWCNRPPARAHALTLPGLTR